MKDAARYVKIVEWSEEDNCFVGSCPGLLFGGCHGDNEVSVFKQLCTAVDEVIELYKQDGKPLPPSTREPLSFLLRDLIEQHGEPPTEDVKWAERALVKRGR